MNITRRKFMKNAGATILVAPFAPSFCNLFDPNELEEPLQVHLFSKHLQFLDVKEASQVSAELGFDGLDLTVRPKSHVLPENAESDLAAAIQDIKESGSACEMITTAISDVNNEFDLKIIEVAAKAGVQYYRSDWFK